MSIETIPSQLDYYYGAKDEVLDMLAGIPGADALNVTPDAPAELYLGSANMANLATYTEDGVEAALRAVISVPDARHLYGIVGVRSVGDAQFSQYGLSRFPESTTAGEAEWHAPITRHQTSIRPEDVATRRLGDSPWAVHFTPGIKPGQLAVSYRGEEFADIIGVSVDPGAEQTLSLEASVWCPSPAALIRWTE